MISDLFEKYNDALKIDIKSRILAELLNGIAQIQFGVDAEIYYASTIVEIGNNGRRHEQIFAGPISFNCNVVSRAVLSVCDEAGNTLPPQREPNCTIWAKLAAHDTRALQAIIYYQQDTPISLYKVYEAIRNDLNQLLVNSKELKRFKASVQYEHAVGRSARHSVFYREEKEPEGGYMSYLEARSYIGQLLTNWLNVKSCGEYLAR